MGIKYLNIDRTALLLFQLVSVSLHPYKLGCLLLWNPLCMIRSVALLLPLANFLSQQGIWRTAGCRCCPGSCPPHLADSSEVTLLSAGVWWLQLAKRPLHGCHLPVWFQGTSTIAVLNVWNGYFLVMQSDYNSPVGMTVQCHCWLLHSTTEAWHVVTSIRMICLSVQAWFRWSKCNYLNKVFNVVPTSFKYSSSGCGLELQWPSTCRWPHHLWRRTHLHVSCKETIIFFKAQLYLLYLKKKKKRRCLLSQNRKDWQGKFISAACIRDLVLSIFKSSLWP